MPFRKLMDYVLLEGPEVVIAPADTVTGYRYLGKDHLLLPGYKFDVDPEVRSRQMSLLDTPEYAMKYLKGSLEDDV